MADFFFTTCPSICLDMAKQKRWLQEEMRSEQDFLMLSHTVMPEVDSVAVLAEYAALQNADPDRWRLLTGERDSIYALARRSYLVAKEPQTEALEHEMIHTENFVLIDRQRRIRGFYDGTSRESVQLLAQHAKQLLGPK
jgi:protein SCO1/2